MFSETPADYLLLEVGLGGRYDATNVIERPAATVITPVSIDHTEFLGATVEKIAYEKAGILRRGAPAIVAEQDERALAVIEREALKLGALRRFAGRDFFIRSEHGRLAYEDADGLVDLPMPRLAGRHQFGNAATAVATLRAIEPGLPNRALERGLTEVEWPARLQRLRGGPLVALAPPQAEVWLDGAHNEAGGRALAEAMADFEDHAPRPLALICGTLTSKDTAGFLRHFKGLAQEALAVPIVGEHAARPRRGSRRDRPQRRPRSRRLRQRRLGAEIPGGARLADAAAHPDRRLALSRRRGARSQRRRAALTQISPSQSPARRQLSPLVASFALAVVRPCRRSTAAMS